MYKRQTYRLTDSSRTALELYREHRAHLYDYLYNCDHNQRLIQRGYPESLQMCIRDRRRAAYGVTYGKKTGRCVSALLCRLSH